MTNSLFPAELKTHLLKVRDMFPDVLGVTGRVEQWLEADTFAKQAFASDDLRMTLSCRSPEDYLKVAEAANLCSKVALGCVKRALSAALEAVRAPERLAALRDLTGITPIPDDANERSREAYRLMRVAQGFLYLARCAEAHATKDTPNG